MKARLPLTTLGLLFGILGAGACGGGSGRVEGGSGGSSSATGGASDGGATGGATSGGGSVDDDGLITTGSNTGEGGDDGRTTCERASARSDLAPVYLALAFDVSGSMGELDRPNWWHDPEAKWRPIVAATRAFLEDPTTERLNASMVLFPAKDDKCEAEAYLDPDVEMTSLPSSKFGEALSAYEEEVGSPLAGGDWRGGTPTFAALSGAATSLAELRQEHPEAAFGVVLITDGLPQSCDEGLEHSVDLAGTLAEDGLATYVIGIENPTAPPALLPEDWSDWGECDEGDGGGDEPCTPPDTLEALNELANAGGTEQAFLIDTQDPEATKQSFLAAIASIRQSTASCTLPVPPHPDGGAFNLNEIDVTVSLEGQKEDLTFDETCSGEGGWHFLGGSGPLTIELCESTCQRITTATGAELSVEFLCEPRFE